MHRQLGIWGTVLLCTWKHRGSVGLEEDVAVGPSVSMAVTSLASLE